MPFLDGSRVQILDTIHDLQHARRHQLCAFIKSERCCVVWADQRDQVIERAATMEAKMLKSIMDSYQGGIETPVSSADSIGSKTDPESGIKERPFAHVSIIITALATALAMIAFSFDVKILLSQYLRDSDAIRFTLAVTIPFKFLLSLFFFRTIAQSAMHILGPVRQLEVNSQTYSGVAPSRTAQRITTLPHFSIQCPVYKESLDNVIGPTIESLSRAITTYELQGGTASIIINDDGMQLMEPAQAQARAEYYRSRGIAFVARPAEGRTGKFKKASNMNHALDLSDRVEAEMDTVIRHSDWTEEDEQRVYSEALTKCLSGGTTWAEGDIRIGDFILIVDSDTRVPADCLLDAALEMEAYPEIGLLQHVSGVMNVSNTSFEKAMAFFTRLCYLAIQLNCANGESSPFMGHNGILRWSAVQEVKDGGYWAEDRVSEDLDMALRLQTAGYVLRLASYSNKEFLEGVSLVPEDEISRWQKYAFGAGETVFNPLIYWFTRTPFTKQFRQWLGSKHVSFHDKVALTAYMSSYYALGFAFIAILANYFVLGLFAGELDQFYQTSESWKLWITSIIIFFGVSSITRAFLEYRLDVSAFTALWGNIKWIPFFFIFFSGMTIHISTALCAQLVNYNMTWSATQKEVTHANFFSEVSKLIKRYKIVYAICLLLSALMAAMALLPVKILGTYTITAYTCIVPLALTVACHVSFPIILNPALTRVRF